MTSEGVSRVRVKGTRKDEGVRHQDVSGATQGDVRSKQFGLVEVTPL